MYEAILTALDGSDRSACGGRIALRAARAWGAKVIACHVYGAELHSRRFHEMEPGLPDEYQKPERMGELRDAHGSLIADGFDALSRGYRTDFLAAAESAGVPAEPVTAEGRNHVEILRIARRCGAGLIVLGASGLGDIGDGLLGGVAARVLRGAACDVLIARRDVGAGGVLAGIDGSDDALGSARAAAGWARMLDAPLELAAAYDPVFHVEVFRAMARSLSDSARREVGLEEQKDLHDRLINEGLARLYREFLDRATADAEVAAAGASAKLLEGKAYAAINARAAETDAALVVVARHGHHHAGDSQIGSNAEAVVRRGGANVLVTCGRGGASEPTAEPEEALEWTPEAAERLQRVPPFVRAMAKRAVEQMVRERGGDRVTGEAFARIAERFGMGRADGGDE